MGTMNKLHGMVIYSVIFEAVIEEVFLCQSSDECSIFGVVWLLICYLSVFVRSSSLPLSRHLATFLSRLGWAWLAPALLHCREVQETSRIELWGFLRYKSNPVYHRPLSSWTSQQFGDISAGGGSEAELHKIQIASFQKLFRHIFNRSIIIMTTK